MNTRDVLIAARKLIEQPERWTTGAMAGIEKIYGTRAQRQELKRYLHKLRSERRLPCKPWRYFYPVYEDGVMPVANFPARLDRWLWRQPDLPQWVRGRNC